MNMMEMRRRMLISASKPPLYIYTSGDTTFRNCTWNDPSYIYINFPSGNNNSYAEVKYLASSQTGDSTYYHWGLTLNQTFKGYKKLFIDICHDNNNISASETHQVLAGFSIDRQDANGEEITQVVTTERTVLEFDISDYQDSSYIYFFLINNTWLQIYNIWLE